MLYGVKHRHAHWRSGPARVLAAVTAVTAAALLTAACSGPSPADSGAAAAAAGPARPASSSPAPGGSSPALRPISQQKQLAYSECMRSHGVPGVPTSFPRPAAGKPPSTGNFRPVQVNGPDPGSPRWLAAQRACRSVLPAPAMVAG
jgi:hypothetical protein